MCPVEEIQSVDAGLIFWQGYDPAVKVDLSSHAVLTPDGWILIDPIPLRDESFDEWREGKIIAAILLTSSNHERAAAAFKKKCGAPIVAHREAASAVSIAPDQLLDDDASFSGLTIIHLPGFAAGEIALHSPVHGGLMVMGDALINLQPGDLEILPHKYCSDPKAARASLQKLLQFSFEVMTFAHGLPIITAAKRRLENLLS